MDVFSAIAGRRSIRSYQNTEVEEEKVSRIIEAGRLAPTASNRQEWKFIIIRNKETKLELAKAAYGQTFIVEAPVIIVACATESKAILPCGQNAYTVDLSIAVSYMILEAFELGLGTCWLGAFQEEGVKAALSIPDHVRVVAMFPVGYPNKNPDMRPRKSMDQIVCFEKYE